MEELQIIFERDENFESESPENWIDDDDWYNINDDIIKKQSLDDAQLFRKKKSVESEIEIDDDEKTILSSSSESGSIKTTSSDSTESLTHPCLQRINISDSELKFLNVYTFYPIPEDPGLDYAFWVLYPSPPTYEPDGVDKFFDTIKNLKVQPIDCMREQLKSDKVDLKHYCVDDEAVQAISEALLFNTTVTALDLQDSPLTPSACLHLNKLLFRSTVLNSLNLTACKIGVEGAKKLEEGLTFSPGLIKLNLSRCELGNEGFSYIAKAVTANTLLQELNVSNNDLDEGCASYIEKLLSLNDSLQILDINWNDFNTKEASEKLINGLTKNNSLIDVDLSWNLLGKYSVSYMSTFISNTKCVKKLNLSSNRLSDTDVSRIANALRNNRSLEIINLDKNPLGSKGVTNFIRVLNSNNFSESPLILLDLSSFWATKEVLPILDSLKEIKPSLEIKLSGILGNWIIVGPDLKELFFKTANFEAMNAKKKRDRKNFGHFVLSLSDSIISKDKFLDILNESKIKISENLAKEIMNLFLVTKKSLDQAELKEAYMSYFPDTKLPPPPVAKAKKTKNKLEGKKNKKDKKGKKDSSKQKKKGKGKKK